VNNPIAINARRVDYFLSDPSEVTLKIYTTQGRCIATVAHEKGKTGFNTAVIPSTVPNGRFILSMENGRIQNCYPLTIVGSPHEREKIVR
jgi:hypothetical protein